MSDENANGTGANPPPEPGDPVDLALAQFEALIRGLENQRSEAEELPKVPEDVPRFVTRSTS